MRYEMVRACSTHGTDRRAYRILVGNQKGRKNLVVGGKMI
jgi:hypothetical protein